jgi:hypothetical protein
MGSQSSEVTWYIVVLLFVHFLLHHYLLGHFEALACSLLVNLGSHPRRLNSSLDTPVCPPGSSDVCPLLVFFMRAFGLVEHVSLRVLVAGSRMAPKGSNTFFCGLGMGAPPLEASIDLFGILAKCCSVSLALLMRMGSSIGSLAHEYGLA